MMTQNQLDTGNRLINQRGPGPNKENNMTRLITVATATKISRHVHAAVNRASDPRKINWNDRIDAFLSEVGLGWKLKSFTYIDGLDCQFIGRLATTIRANAIEK